MGSEMCIRDSIIRQLVAANNEMVTNFQAALRERTDDYVRDANMGRGRVQILPTSLSRRHHHAQTAYEMDEHAYLADWRPGGEGSIV